MSHRSRSINPLSGKLELPHGPSSAIPIIGSRPAAANAPPRLEMLVPYLMGRGAIPQIDLGWSGEGRITFVAHCGPISIPIAVDVEVFDEKIIPALELARTEALAVRHALEASAASGDLPPVPDGCEDLLAGAAAAVYRPIELGADPTTIEVDIPPDAMPALEPDDAPDHAAGRLILPAEACTDA